MPTELQLRAAEAWRLMTRIPSILDSITGAEAMPHGAAIDYCQDVAPGNDRDEAVTALVNAGADWLDAQALPSGAGEIHAGCFPDSELIRSYIRCESFSTAVTFLEHIRDRCYQVNAFPRLEMRHEWLATADWSRWTDKAKSVIAHLCAVVAAAYPVEAETRL